MVLQNVKQAVQETYELRETSSSKATKDGAQSATSAFPSSLPPRPPRYSKRAKCSMNYFTAILSLLLLAASSTMLVLTGHAVHLARNIHPKSYVGVDPGWPLEINGGFEIWILCMATFSFIQAVAALYVVLFTKQRNSKEKYYKLAWYFLFAVLYAFMLFFDDVTSSHPVTTAEGVSHVTTLRGGELRIKRTYPTIISWTCMKKDNPGDSSIRYGTICHESVVAKYLGMAVFLLYIVAFVIIAVQVVVGCTRRTTGAREAEQEVPCAEP